MPLTSYPRDKINILLLENISDNAVLAFKNAGYGHVKKLERAYTEEELLENIGDVHLLGIRSKTILTERVLRNAKKLLAAGCYCIGVNQVDLEAANKNGIVVFNSPFSNTRSVAELVLGLSIILLRRIPEKNIAAHKGIWLKNAAGSFELRGKTIGIIGYGNIGSQVSVLAEAFGMQVIYYDTESKLPLGNARAVRTLKELLQNANIVTLHIPENAGTRDLIGKNEFELMQPGSIFINYARGSLTDLNALRAVIESGHIAGAAIDVFPEEPEKNGAQFESPLHGLTNVILTPHIGGSTEEAQLSISEDVSHKLLNYLENGNTSGSFTVPQINLPPLAHTHRILHIHKNVPGVISDITARLSAHKINILAQYLKTNDEIGYTVLDVDSSMSAEAFQVLKDVAHTIKTRMVY